MVVRVRISMELQLNAASYKGSTLVFGTDSSGSNPDAATIENNYLNIILNNILDHG